MPLTIRGNVTGARQVASLLRGLEAKYFRPAARKGINDGTIVVRRAARTNLRRNRTGSLLKSIGRKVKAVKGGKGYYGVIGPRRDPSARKFAQQQADYAAGRRKAAPRMKYRRTVNHKGVDIVVDPAKYAHLVEYGRRAVVAGTKDVYTKGSKGKPGKKSAQPTGKLVLSDGTTIYGPRVRAVPPMPFMRPAWVQSEKQCYEFIKRRAIEAKNQAARGSK